MVLSETVGQPQELVEHVVSKLVCNGGVEQDRRRLWIAQSRRFACIGRVRGFEK